jgi:integrase
VAGETAKNIGSHLKAMETFENRDPASITPADVQEWLATLELKPTSVRRYIGTLRAILDFADADPNPARDPRVRLPREEQAIPDPPSAADVETIIATVNKRRRLPLRMLEQTGMRVGELHALEWGDVYEAGAWFRVKAGKTPSARRWVAVPEWVMAEVAETCRREDRTAERRVFPGFTPDLAKKTMARACVTAGIVHRHPHDLQHRYASVQIANGVPVTPFNPRVCAADAVSLGRLLISHSWRVERGT